MLLENTARNVQSTGIMQTARATIKATPKIFSMFEDGTYSNKPLAIARELVANGVDSHTAAGCPDRPVELTLPIELDPVFKVRDFGIGMTHLFLVGDPDAGVPSKFMAYTDGSTKDGNNDQIGGFGIGSKSPFSYVDQFTIRSVCEGVLGVYSIYKAEDGVPEIGCLGQTTTDEPNGVEVSFPVQAEDIASFHEAAQQALQYFKPLPTVINGCVHAPDYTYEAREWGMRAEAGELGVVMGGVRYPVSSGNLEYTLRSDARLSPLLGYGLDLFLPIGTCGVAMSREGLSYKGDTSKNIQAALEGVIDDVIATFSTMFDDCPSLWDAAAKLGREVGFNQYSQSPRAKLLAANARYRGQPLGPTIALSKSGQMTVDCNAWWIYSAHDRGARKSLMTMKWEHITQLGTLQPGNIEAVIVDDLPQSPRSKTSRKIRAYIEDECHRNKPIMCLRAPHDNTHKVYIAHMLQQLGNPSNVIYTSTLPEPAAVARTKTERPRVRMWTFNGKNDRFTRCQIENLTPAHSKREAVAEVDYKDQPATGTAVVMNSFQLPDDFHERMTSQLVRFDELHFVNEGDWVKLKDTWKNFDDVFDARLKAALAAYPELPTRIALYRNEVLRDLFALASQAGGPDRLTPAQLRRPFGRIATLWKEYLKPLTSDQHRLAPFVTAALPDRINPAKLVASFATEQADCRLLLDVLDLDKKEHLAFFLKNL